jgi:Cysteine-rich secretory protein family
VQDTTKPQAESQTLKQPGNQQPSKPVETPKSPVPKAQTNPNDSPKKAEDSPKKAADSSSKLDRTIQKDDISVHHDGQSVGKSVQKDALKQVENSRSPTDMTSGAVKTGKSKIESPSLVNDMTLQSRKNVYAENHKSDDEEVDDKATSKTGYQMQKKVNDASSVKPSDKPFSLKTIVDALNDIRTNPSKYADRVQFLYLDHINDKGMNMRTKMMTLEGKAPYLDAKRHLSSQKPVSKCELDDGLTAAAYLHSVYCASIGQQTHNSKDGGGPMDRIKQFGMMLQGMCAENVLSRNQVSAEEWILDFIIDDGFASRGHRKNIFNPQVSRVGLGVARLAPNSDWYFTMDFTSDSYKSETTRIPSDVMAQSGLADYHKQRGY